MDDVSFSYQDSLVLERITLHVERGTTLGIIGPNGSGKTTLLKIMLGLLRPDSGYVQILGLGPQQACASGSLVGYVPQRHTLDLQFPVSARQVVELGAVGGRGVGGRPTEADRRRAEQLLASVGMSDAAETPIGELSGGQQQRVFVARALVAGPQVLFLDEPMTGVDVGAQEHLMALLDRLKREMNLTLVMVSHNLRAIIGTCDRLACLARTLHYHDHPNALPADVLARLFQCDYDALLELRDHAL